MFTVTVECVALNRTPNGVNATFSVPRPEFEALSAPSVGPGPMTAPWTFNRELTPAEAEGFLFGGSYVMTVG